MATILIGYGGFGCNVVKQYSLANDSPCLLIDTNDQTASFQSSIINTLRIGEDGFLDKGELNQILYHYRNILLISSLGGESFDNAYRMISECARVMDVPIVSLCSIPYIFESERRARAYQNLEKLRESSSNMFIFDLQRMIQYNRSTQDFFEDMSSFVQGCIDTLLYLTEKTPFYSYCSGSAYTLAISESPMFSDSIKSALGHLLFETVEVQGKVLVCFDRDVDDFEIEISKEMLLSYSGNLPELVRIPGIEEGFTLLFIPISFHRHV